MRLVQTTKTLATWGWTNAYIYQIGNEHGSLKRGVLSAGSAARGTLPTTTDVAIEKWRAGLPEKCDFASRLQPAPAAPTAAAAAAAASQTNSKSLPSSDTKQPKTEMWR